MSASVALRISNSSLAQKISCGTMTLARIAGSFRRFLVATIRLPRSRCLRRGRGASRRCRPRRSLAVIRAGRITHRVNASSDTPAIGMSSGMDAPKLVALASVRMTNFQNRRIQKIALAVLTTRQTASRRAHVRSPRQRHPESVLADQRSRLVAPAITPSRYSGSISLARHRVRLGVLLSSRPGQQLDRLAFETMDVRLDRMGGFSVVVNA